MLKENSKIKLSFYKWFVILISLTLVLIAAGAVLLFMDFSAARKPKLGVTFNQRYAMDLGLDWRQAYLEILDDLRVERIRLSAPWNLIEPKFDQYDFADLDWQIQQAELRGVEVILAVGRRTPRWPECHDPDWLDGLAPEKIQQEQLTMVRDTVWRYREYSNIVMWQVENEPFLSIFGQCPRMPLALLQQEIALVKSLDQRPVLVTDSGELSSWVQTAGAGDKFGHTVYRLVFNDYIGYYHYYLPPVFYRFKAWIMGLSVDDVLVAELQAEPWVPSGYTLELDYPEMIKLMSTEKVENNLHFAQKTGASEIYLWGVEWWYWMKVNAANPDYWLLAKRLIAEYP